VKKSLQILIALLLTTLSLSVESVSLLEQGGVRPNSLTQNPQSYYEAFQARKIGDVVTVRVVENVEALKRNQINIDNDTRSDNDLTFQLAMTATSTLDAANNDIANMVTSFRLPVDYSRRNQREIEVDNREEFFTLLSCLVVEIDPESGNMIIEGSRQILMEGQTKSLYVRGIVFPKDIDSNGEIPSYKLANAQIQIIGSGSLTKDRDSGLIQKIFRRIF
jgi:flagellar L-ring protein precursor FlgH